MAIETPPDFGTRLTAAMAARRVKQTELARRCGISRSYMTQMCSGDRRPSAPVSMCMERELGAEAWAYVMARSDVLPVISP
jgi:transcriptional regulator with XRE-family HTH domain